MSSLPNTTVANGIVDRSSGQIVAKDVVLATWLGDCSLSSLLPDLQLNLAVGTNVEHTRLCCSGKEPEFATVEVTPLDGGSLNWSLLRIEVSSFPAKQQHDVVTDLPDRRALESHRARWRRESSQKQFAHAVFFLDLDNFKQINDECGHMIGDQVLSVLAGRWKKSLRGKDLIVRYGGDEFVALVAGVRSVEEAQPIVDRLRRVTADPITIDGRSIEIGVTIGVALADSLEMALEELLAAADKAMYASKRSSQ